MPSLQELLPLVTDPREDLSAEYKEWLDLTTIPHRAKVAKAAIALVNHGGGFIVLGFEDGPAGLVSTPKPASIPDLTQDAVNAAIARFAAPEFHCALHAVVHPTSGVTHPIIVVPGSMKEPVMSRRAHEGEIAQHRCYIRKPGPRSEEPLTAEEWRSVISRCVRAGRDDMLEAIRAIVQGRVEPVAPTAAERLDAFTQASRARWSEITRSVPENAGPQFPKGSYDISFALVGARVASGLSELQQLLQKAREIKLTGWTPFLELNKDPWAPYPHDNTIEAWVGRPIDNQYTSGARADFWRATPAGELYMIRGYTEDDLESVAPGTVIDVTLPVWRVGEAVLFAARLADAFGSWESLAVRYRFTGLEGRSLVSINGQRAMYDPRVARTPSVTLQMQLSRGHVSDNLVEAMTQLLSPLYECFGFFKLPSRLVDEELTKMIRGRF